MSGAGTDLFGQPVVRRASRAWCWRSGEIGFGQATDPMPKGVIDLACGSPRRLRDIVSVNARHAYDGGTLLVPGIPEATDDTQALAAAKRFGALVKLRLAGECGWPAADSSLVVVKSGR